MTQTVSIPSNPIDFSGRRVILWALLGLVVLELMMVSLCAWFGVAPLLPAALVAIIFGFWSIQSPKVWVVTVILFHILILPKSEGITVWEILFGLYFLGGTGVWFVRKFLRRGKIILSRADTCLIVFFSLVLLSIIPGLLNHATILKWFREMITFSAYLAYFPLREALSDKRTLPLVGIGFLILALSIGWQNLTNYRHAATSAIYAWQLLSGRQTANEPLFMASILVGVPMFLYAKSLKSRLFLLMLIAFFMIALVLTFSRGYWIGAILGMVVLLLMMNGKDRIRMVVTTAILGILAVGIMTLFFSSQSSTIFKTIVGRLGSNSLSVASDISLYTRLAETRAVFDLITHNPLVGYGLGFLFRFYNPADRVTVETWYVHNGYLFLWLKLGLFGLMAFLFAYVTMIRDGYRMTKAQKNEFSGYLLSGLLSVLVAMLAVSITSPQFITRDSILIIILCWAMIGSVRRSNDGEEGKGSLHALTRNQ
ncbi:MAG: O-antigen ligase family protein [Ignavibacteria bacterium]|nr:O-antigen ligase family protein [Ignavibacteria bacterium]MBI3766130.1 O-antigen ligase family protein [Ignavibacteriales bacterium]